MSERVLYLSGGVGGARLLDGMAQVLEPDQLAEGRVTSVTCRQQTVCVTRFEGCYAALDNACPHQGGPLGEGSIENGWLRCPWHGWDYHPTTGKSPGGFDDGVETFPVEEREDGIYVGFPVEDTHATTVTDVMAESLANWGVRWVTIDVIEFGSFHESRKILAARANFPHCREMLATMTSDNWWKTYR